MMYQVIDGLPSKSQKMPIEVRLIFLNLFLDHHFQLACWVHCGCLSTPICPDETDLQPNKVHVHDEGQRSLSGKQ